MNVPPSSYASIITEDQIGGVSWGDVKKGGRHAP